jgi:hypothetical protein
MCRFTEAQARAFMLLHVFLHELGHHRMCKYLDIQAERPKHASCTEAGGSVSVEFDPSRSPGRCAGTRPGETKLPVSGARRPGQNGFRETFGMPGV